MKLHFLSAQDSSSNHSSSSYAFTYTLDDSTSPHTIQIAGNQAPEDTEEAQHDYAQRLFAGALFVTQTIWQQTKHLPDQHHVYQEGMDFPSEVMSALPWEGYELALTD